MIARRHRRAAGLAGLVAACLLAGHAGAQDGNPLTNLLKYGGVTVPPSQPKEVEAAYCPTVDVPEGGAALRTLGGRGGDGVRQQVTLGRLARECTRLQDGSVSIKLGIEARVLLGPGGAPGRFDVPLTIQIKADEKVVTTRALRLAVTVAPGEAQGFTSVVEDGRIVPAGQSAEYEIFVGLGGKVPAASGKAAKRRRKPAVAAGSGDAPGAAQ